MSDGEKYGKIITFMEETLARANKDAHDFQTTLKVGSTVDQNGKHRTYSLQVEPSWGSTEQDWVYVVNRANELGLKMYPTGSTGINFYV